MLKRTLLSSLAGVALGLATSSASAVVITQLGAAIDSSGSMSASDFVLQKAGWADAVGNLPTDGSVEVTMVRFASSASVVITPVVVDSVATRTALSASINAISKSGNGSGTSIHLGISVLASAILASTNYSASIDSFMNLSSDGGSTASTAAAAAVAAQIAGIDSLTAEAVGLGVNTATLLRTAFNPGCTADTGCSVLLGVDSAPPNPLTSAWVLPVSNFSAFGVAINSKVSAITNTVPEPGSLALVAISLGGLAFSARRRRRMA